jgi:IS5 family transposase
MTGAAHATLVEGQTLLAGRAYDSDELRKSLDERGAWANGLPQGEGEA